MGHMQIKDIEVRSGMDRAKIRFYEREGLIKPERMENGYRDYSENDLQILLRIKLLRSLHISLEEIKALNDGSEDLTSTLSRQLRKLYQEEEDISYAKDVCRAMHGDEVSFANLDAQKYLDGIELRTKDTGSSYFSVKGDEIPQVFHPWRRFFARMIDFSIYEILWLAFIGLGFHVNIVTRSFFGDVIDTIVSLLLMLFLEPVLLHFFATTPGKAIFGLRIENPDGSHLSYGQGLERTFGVLAAGMGFNIPIFYLFRLWRSYKLCIQNEVQPWDIYISYSMKDRKTYRNVLCLGAYGVLSAILFTIVSAQQLPPNRGDLTVAEFAENHNYYAKTLELDFGNEYLDESGVWMKEEYDGTQHITYPKLRKGEYNFTIEDGYVTGISFPVNMKNQGGWVIPDNSQMVLASLALAGAQDEVKVFSKVPNRIADQIDILQDFDFTEAGITFTYSDSIFSIEKIGEEDIF